MDQSTKDRIEKWKNGGIDEETRIAIDQLNEEELTDCFYKNLEFGTGGLRGIMGVGSNRINKYTIGTATQGLSNYLKKSFPNQDLKVAIAHDSRNNSPEFAKVTADVFSANGIKVYFFEALRPTPELSFAIRHFGCQSGVVLTASHNPKEYNGYKAYWTDGAQMVSPHDVNVIKEVEAIDNFSKVKFQGDPSIVEYIGQEIDDLYLKEITKLCLNPGVIERQKNIGIVFTPIHGTGITLVPPVLDRLGFSNINVVEEQANPDGNFPTVVYPNPEEAEAMTLAMNKAREIDADLVMATDPDADRVGIAVKNTQGDFQLLNGNQTATLIIYYLLTQWKTANKLDGNQYIVKTIVTTDLLDKIAEDFNVECPNTLTGFKYIASILLENEGKKEFIAGGEESYGYLISDFVRDKDAIASCAVIAEIAAYAKDNGVTLYEMLLDIYLKFGIFHEELMSITKKGKTGAEEIQEIMARMRANPPKNLSGVLVSEVIDYQSSTKINCITGMTEKIDFPKSNVLQYRLEDGSKISARPSGTEPKIKFYFSVNTDLDNIESYGMKLDYLKNKVSTIKTELSLN